MKPPIFITGMHRSGTSLTANLLRKCGLWLGPVDQLHGSTSSNPDGHWEYIRVTELNDALLNELGGGWDDVLQLSKKWWKAGRFPALEQQAADIHAALARPTPWGWKDPRASLLMQFWLSKSPTARIVVCIRHPIEVAQSLRSRGGMSLSLGLKLWRAYNQHLLADVSPERRILVHFDHWFAQPALTLERVSEFCGLAATSEQIQSVVATAKPELRHASYLAEDLVVTSVAPDIIALYAQLCTEALFAGVPKLASVGRADSLRQIDLEAFKHRNFIKAWNWFVRKSTSEGARVAVVSKGDNELLRFEKRHAYHFPGDESGRYLGYHPVDDAEAVARLDAAQASGVQFLALPDTALWWLDSYSAFAERLRERHQELARDKRLGLIFRLNPTGP